MRVKKIAIVLRKDGFFHHDGKKIKAVYPGEGYVVMLFLENSPIDKDFEEDVLVLTEDQRKEIEEKFAKSDKLTHKLLGHGWNGKRPFWKLEDFM